MVAIPKTVARKQQDTAGDAEARALQLHASAQHILAWQQQVTIRNDDQLTEAANALHTTKEIAKRAEAERKELVDPLNATVRKINAKFRPFTSTLELLEKHLKTLIARYEEKKSEVQRAEAEKRARKAERAGEEELAEDIRSTAAALPAIRVEGISFRDNWKASVVDPSKLPREFLVPDMDKLNALAKESRGTADVPGVEFVNDRIVAARS